MCGILFLLNLNFLSLRVYFKQMLASHQHKTSTTVADSGDECEKKVVVRPRKPVAEVTISEEHEKFMQWIEQQKSEGRLKKGKSL